MAVALRTLSERITRKGGGEASFTRIIKAQTLRSVGFGFSTQAEDDHKRGRGSAGFRPHHRGRAFYALSEEVKPSRACRPGLQDPLGNRPLCSLYSGPGARVLPPELGVLAHLLAPSESLRLPSSSFPRKLHVGEGRGFLLSPRPSHPSLGGER